MKKLIMFLARKKLGVKKYEGFRFANQRSEDDWYFFGANNLYKVTYNFGRVMTIRSRVSFNWLIDDNCEIYKIGEKYKNKDGAIL